MSLSMELGVTGIPFAAIAAFAVVTSSTPGPNNLLLTYSGLAFGFRKTLPAFAGVYLGCCVLFLFCALGISALVTSTPLARPALGYLGGAYLAYMGWRMLGTQWTGTAAPRPVRCASAALMQLVNPKLWWMCAFTLARFAPADAPVSTLTVVAATFMLFTVPALTAYTLLGSMITRFAGSSTLRLAVNRALALATLITAVLVVVGAQ